jgi:hypothetical protein
MSEIITTILAKALLVVLEALLTRLALYLVRSMRYQQSPAPA